MKIRYTRKRLTHYLIIGSLWLILGVAAVLFDPENIFSYGYPIIGALYLAAYLFENSKQYLTIENDTLSQHHLIPKKVNLNEIEQIKKSAGDYVLRTSSAELRINTAIVEEKSLEDLDAVLDKLNLETR